MGDMRGLIASVLVALVSFSVLAGDGTAGRRPSIVLVPVGAVGKPSLRALAAHFRQKLRVNVQVSAPVAIPADAYDGSRHQYVGDKLMAQVEHAYPRGVVIGITTRDIYMTQRSFRFVFSLRDARAAVVSTARMDPTFYGLPSDDELLTSRIEKMTAKNIGVLALGRHESSNPRSVLYTPILSLNDLDYMTEDFAPHPYSTVKRAWLARMGSACDAGGAQKASLRAVPVHTTNDLLSVFGKRLDIEKSLFSTLQSLRPARGDRALVAKLRSSFSASVSLDEATFASLSASWDATRFKQWGAQSGAINAGLFVTALRLGSRPCAGYFTS
jgi:predicted Zn-dependent protease